ncbi:DNA repair protein [Cyclospora cayetanensis]|uniref:DNA repair protein n=1 Tax=Cyclospora cayetanensis TaxID=88456 RepID=A0A1D3CTD4_9EIME|nr:DNA repair protein [Cyclospora cayetanensis]
MRRIPTRRPQEGGDGGAESSGVALCLVRAPLMPLLTVEAGASILFRPFKRCSEESLRKTLGVRLKRSSCFLTGAKQFKSPPPLTSAAASDAAPYEPLILYEPQKDGERKVEVDPMLTRWLREHQRQGVRFVFDCLMGLRDFDGYGCILADDMGLGKTLQSITVLWTLLVQGIDTAPEPTRKFRDRGARAAATVEAYRGKTAHEPQHGRVALTSPEPAAFCLASDCKPGVECVRAMMHVHREAATKGNSRVLIASYETFRAHAHRVASVPIDLVICDEAHRLKNDKTKTAVAISQLPAKKRLLLSGTPIQNDLDEFYALVSLCNPNVVGDAYTFRRRYATPILVGREPGATEAEQELAAERLAELSSITNMFILRRTNALLAKVLPPKIIINLFCNLSPLQVAFYQEFLKSKCCRKLLDGDASGSSGLTGKVLSSIQGLMKLCNHPMLVKNQSLLLTGFEKCAELFEQLDLEGTKTRIRSIRPDVSGKMLAKCVCLPNLALAGLLHAIRVNTSDKVVLISNYTQTLDLFERLCKDSGYPCVRLDGSTSIKKRHDLITKFNDPNGSAATSFAFLLSSKAGGCGVNLVGANRLVLFDPDWNPANDKQALARVWRDGQKKTCYIYRMFSTGTIEEKIYQRQICKDGLSAMLVSEGENQIKDSLSTDLVKDLFQLRETRSDTHDMLDCQRCKRKDGELLGMVPQLVEGFEEDDLLTWAHHADLTTIPDTMLLKAIEAAQVDVSSREGPETNGSTGAKKPMSLEDALEYFQPVSFAMSCRVEFNKEAEEMRALNKVLLEPNGDIKRLLLNGFLPWLGNSTSKILLSSLSLPQQKPKPACLYVLLFPQERDAETPLPKKKLRGDDPHGDLSKPGLAPAAGDLEKTAVAKTSSGLTDSSAENSTARLTNSSASSMDLQNIHVSRAAVPSSTAVSHGERIQVVNGDTELSSGSEDTTTSEEEMSSDETEASTEGESTGDSGSE